MTALDRTASGELDLAGFLAAERERVEEALVRASDALLADVEPRLGEAMRYSLLAGGKRLRPILCLAAARAVGGRDEAAMGVALAIEMVHTYSLVHDDLPCMDDDDLRRGRPTSHKVYGEALALLAGDALITSAFELAATPTDADPSARVRLEVVRDLAAAAGSHGMVSGQVQDIESTGTRPEIAQLERMHARKTGALIRVALTSGAKLGGGSDDQIAALERYGHAIGLAFQVVDDVLDITASTEVLGKTAAKDLDQDKATFPALIGLDASRERAAELVADARGSLGAFGEAGQPLVALASWIVERDR